MLLITSPAMVSTVYGGNVIYMSQGPKKCRILIFLGWTFLNEPIMISTSSNKILHLEFKEVGNLRLNYEVFHTDKLSISVNKTPKICIMCKQTFYSVKLYYFCFHEYTKSIILSFYISVRAPVMVILYDIWECQSQEISRLLRYHSCVETTFLPDIGRVWNMWLHICSSCNLD